MSINNETYLKMIADTGTIGTSGQIQISASDDYCHSLMIGIADASNTAYVGGASVTVANLQGKKITVDAPFSASTVANDRGTVPINLADYYVAGTNGDVIWWLYHQETQQT